MKCMVNFEGISRISCALCGLVSCNDLCLIGNHLESIFSWNIFDDVGPWFWNSGIGFLEKNMLVSFCCEALDGRTATLQAGNAGNMGLFPHRTVGSENHPTLGDVWIYPM